MLITIENVLSKDEVRQFRGWLDQASWQDGSLTGGTLARQVKQNLQLPDQAEPALSLGQHILRNLATQPLFISAALPRKIFPPKFNCYQDGGNYGTHVDSAVMQLPGNHGSLRSDLSATLFLSEPHEYEGGVLEVESEFGVQSVKLAAGDMVLYPSSSLHRVTPVTAGARLASFFWIESMVADEGERSLLFDLDRTVQNLSLSLPGDHHELVRLTGIYHNLLRRWALT
jgi:PKHD-type hydroxylase